MRAVLWLFLGQFAFYFILTVYLHKCLPIITAYHVILLNHVLLLNHVILLNLDQVHL